MDQVVQPLNIRAIQGTVRGAAQYIQDEKIEIARTVIAKQQYAGKWPEQYNSFVGTETRNNLYREPDKFFRYMHERPKWYARKFIFRPLSDGTRIKEAVIYALGIIDQKTAEYIRAPNVSGKPSASTGAYGASFLLMNNYKKITAISELDSLEQNAKVQITNITPYASTVERNALYYARTTGVIYYAAQMTAKKYPELGVSFTYPRSASVPGALSKYQIPMLTIGSRSVVVDKIVRPGKSYRRGLRMRRSKR